MGEAEMDQEEQKTQEQDASSPSEQAVRDTETEKKSPLEKVEYMYIGVMVLALAAIALTLGLVFGLRKSDTVVMAPRATPSPSIVSSEQPSSAPTGVLNALMETLPDYTMQSLEEFGTPQWKALDWLNNHPNITVLAEWRKTEMFALATFFYAMEGENWVAPVRERWMMYDIDACLWFSSSFGSFGEDGTFSDPSEVLIYPCNNIGEFQSLALSGLGLDGLSPYLPPELALLTSLQGIYLDENEIRMPLSDFIPSELSQLASLNALSLANNEIYGSIPSSLGVITSLTVLDLSNNLLTGAVPAELNPSNFEVFNVEGNNLMA